MSDATRIEVDRISERESEIIRHSLGLNYQKKSYRNHFATDPDSDDGKACSGLEARGLMSLGTAAPWSSLKFYHVTKAGVLALSVYDALLALDAEGVKG